MSTVFVSFYRACPPTSGAGSVTFECARRTSGGTHLVQLCSADAAPEQVDGIDVRTLRWSAGRWGKLAGLRSAVSRVVAQCVHLAPAAVVLEGASWTLYHLLLLRALRRRLPDVTVAYHAHNVEYVLRREKHTTFVTAVTRWAEGRLFREADLAFVVSEVDRAHVEELYAARPLLLPNGVATERFSAPTDERVAALHERFGTGGDVLLFMGAYAYLPNREAIDALMGRIVPALRERRPDLRLAVTGGTVPRREPWLIGPLNLPSEDLPAFVRSCTLGVAPIWSGSGTRLKVLEYMAAGRPVVATAKAVEGLDLRPGDHYVAAERPDDFVARIDELLADPERVSALGEAGRRAVHERYAWRRVIPALEQALSAHVRGSGGSARP